MSNASPRNARFSQSRRVAPDLRSGSPKTLPKAHRAGLLVGLCLLLEAPAYAAGGGSANGMFGGAGFELVALLIILAYLTYLGYSLHSRLDALEQGLGTLPQSPVPVTVAEASPIPEVRAFSWDAALAAPSGAVGLLGDCIDLGNPGLHLLATSSGRVMQSLVSQVVFESMRHQNVRVLLVSGRTGLDELGQRLLSLESGQAWGRLATAEQNALLRSLERQLVRYQEQVQVLADLDERLEATGRLVARQRASHPEDRLVVLFEDPTPLRTEAEEQGAVWLDQALRLGTRNRAAVIVVTAPLEEARLQGWHGALDEGCKTLALLTPDAETVNALRLGFVRSPARDAATSSLRFELHPTTGQLRPLDS